MYGELIPSVVTILTRCGKYRVCTLTTVVLMVATAASLFSVTAFGQEKVAEGGNTVIAEGVGTTRDEATKDAYRNAIRQVVGLYVDAESLVKNDELLDDKVLTYSDGLITKAEVVPGSEKKQGTLVRLKVKATVERKSLVAKLKAANFTVKSVDGESMFAKAVTELDSAKDATSLLKKGLADLPTMLTAEVVGKPDYDQEKSEIVVSVRVHSDRKAYTAFSKRMEETLGKIAVAKDSIAINAEPLLVRGRDGRQNVHDGGYITLNQPAVGGPRLKNGKQWAIWLNTFNNASHTTTKWNVYIVEADMKLIVPMLEFASARGLSYGKVRPDEIHHPSDARTQLVLSALDGDGNLVTEYETELIADYDAAYAYGQDSSGALPLMRHFLVRNYDSTGGSLSYSSVSQTLQQDGLKDYKSSINLYVSPYALAVKQYGQGWSLAYYPSLQSIHRFKATLDELKQIRELKCEVRFKPPQD